MNILLDENIPVQLRAFFGRHVVASVNDAAIGWKGVRNGLLLDQMEGRFDLLITADRNMYAQQTLSGRTVAILVIPTNRRKIVVGMAEQIAESVDRICAGDYVVLPLPGEA